MGIPLAEYHVDSSELFQEQMNQKTAFGRNRIIRYPFGRMLVIWDHGEAIAYTKKCWSRPNEEIGLVPKDEGIGLMISALQSCEFGFCLEMSEEQLKEVNKYREGKNYIYGIQKQGYWNYDHMVLQLEDCVNCLKVLFPEYDYFFLFNHSCGHDVQREDGLNVERMLKSYGGKQAILHDTLIKQEKGYLGTHLWTLKPEVTRRRHFKIVMMTLSG
jgi:hypothetical protein